MSGPSHADVGGGHSDGRAARGRRDAQRVARASTFECDDALDGEQGGCARPRHGATRQRCDIAPRDTMPAAVSATDRLAAIDSPVGVAELCRHAVKAQGASYEPADSFHHKPGDRSVALHRFRFAGRALFDPLHRNGDLHRQLFRDVLAGLALCGSHHRAEVAVTRRVERRWKVLGERSRVRGYYCRPPDPCIDSSGRVSPNAVPFLPAATPTSYSACMYWPSNGPRLG